MLSSQQAYDLALYYVLFITDASANQPEGDETNNLRAHSQQIEVRAADLQVVGLGVTPASPQSGGSVTVTWQDRNNGNSATDVGAWTDQIIVTNTTTGQTLLTANVPYSGGILSAQGVADRQFTFTLPPGDTGVGNLTVTITVDSSSVQAEGNVAGTGETNNASSSSRTSTLTPFADLATSNLTVAGTSPLTIAGDLVALGWTVTNTGSAITGNGAPGGTVDTWIDRIVLSSDAVFGNADDIFVADVRRTGALGPGEQYTGNWSGRIPTGTSGTYFFLVNSDFGLGQAAVFENNNTASNLVQSAASYPIASIPYADLTTVVTVSPSIGQIGQTFDLAWVVTNNATNALATTSTSSWVDRVILSRDAVYGNADDISLGEYQSVRSDRCWRELHRRQNRYHPIDLFRRRNGILYWPTHATMFMNTTLKTTTPRQGANCRSGRLTF